MKVGHYDYSLSCSDSRTVTFMSILYKLVFQQVCHHLLIHSPPHEHYVWFFNPFLCIFRSAVTYGGLVFSSRSNQKKNKQQVSLTQGCWGWVRVGCCISFASVLFFLLTRLSLLSYHFPLSSCHPWGACSAVMLSDSLPACSLPTHMPTLGHVPHGHRCARITEFQKLGGMKSKKNKKESLGYRFSDWCAFRHNTELNRAGKVQSVACW